MHARIDFIHSCSMKDKKSGDALTSTRAERTLCSSTRILLILEAGNTSTGEEEEEEDGQYQSEGYPLGNK
jgi:hypothetical protein